MFATRLWRGRAIPQGYAASCCGSRSRKTLLMTPEFEFPNSLIGREQFPQVPPTTATWRTLELSGSATVSLRFGSSAGIAELDCNGAPKSDVDITSA